MKSVPETYSVTKNILATSIPFPQPIKIKFTGAGWHIVGYSTNYCPIYSKSLVPRSRQINRPHILLIGGVHGNETEGVSFMYEFCDEFVCDHHIFALDYHLTVIPILNPDGFSQFCRKNGNLVDLNRNMPTNDWSRSHEEAKYYPGQTAGSEPETQALIQVIDRKPVDYIVSFHSWKPLINYNGPAKQYAEEIYKTLPMKVVPDIGYPTPGSLGTWAGKERGIPTITLEFERGLELDQYYPLARQAIINSIKITDK